MITDYNKDCYGVVYMIENILNGKLYIGQTVNIKNRMYQHLSDALKDGKTHLSRAIRKHGTDNFIYYILEETNTKEELNSLEIYYIELYDTYRGHGYNMTPGGEGNPKGENHPYFGRKVSEEHRKIMSKTHKNKKVSEETKKKMSDSKEGVYIGEKNPNAKLSEEEVLKIIELINSKKYKQKEIGEMFNVKQLVISRINTGRTWKHLHHLINR